MPMAKPSSPVCAPEPTNSCYSRIKRTEFRDAMARLERAPERAVPGESKLGKIYTFIGTKGGVGTTTLAVNFAAVLAQRKHPPWIDLDWVGNDVAMQLGAAPQYTLTEVAENLDRMDQAALRRLRHPRSAGLFPGGPPDALETAATSPNTCSASSPPSWWRNTTPS